MHTVHVGQETFQLAFHRIQLLNIYGAAIAKENDKYGKPDRSLGSCDSQYEKDEDLARFITQVARKSDEVEIHGQQHEFDAHQQQYQVAPIDEYPRHAECKEHG
jgi:hypothetical protein